MPKIKKTTKVKPGNDHFREILPSVADVIFDRNLKSHVVYEIKM